MLLIALVVGILRVIYFVAVRATHAAGSVDAAALPAVTGDSWYVAQTADAPPAGNTVAAKVHQVSLVLLW